jgi:hypothetical protein
MVAMQGEPAETGDAVLGEISRHALPFLDRFSSRTLLVTALRRNGPTPWARPAPIVLAARARRTGKAQ